MTEEMAGFLIGPAGRELLARADDLREAKTETLAALTRLRRSGAPEQAAAAWEMSDLRRRAVVKFGAWAPSMFFTREALEQASSAGAAAYHAARFAQAGVGTVADLCGGVGGDALAFARRGLRVTLLELDPARALFARENARAQGLDARITVVQGDVMAAPLDAQAAWFDPARRVDRRRVVGPDEYAPPLSWLRALEERGVSNIGVKVSPAIDHGVAAEYGAELEFLSDGGECKEALLWRGALRLGVPGVRATRLTPGGPLTLTGTPDEADEGLASAAGSYLYEPDPALIRAHLIGTLARQIGAAPIFPQIAYLIGDERAETPWAVAYEILERFPWSRRRLQAALTARGVGRVVIKKRGFPQEPDEVRKALKLAGPHQLTVVLTRGEEGHQALLCRPVGAA